MRALFTAWDDAAKDWMHQQGRVLPDYELDGDDTLATETAEVQFTRLANSATLQVVSADRRRLNKLLMSVPLSANITLLSSGPRAGTIYQGGGERTGGSTLMHLKFANHDNLEAFRKVLHDELQKITAPAVNPPAASTPVKKWGTVQPAAGLAKSKHVVDMSKVDAATPPDASYVREYGRRGPPTTGDERDRI